MTGPQHYREAERLMTFVDGQRPDNDDAIIGRALKMAHVHAMLAVAAATLEAGPHHPPAWDQVLDG